MAIITTVRPSIKPRSYFRSGSVEVGRGRPQVDRDRADDADGVEARQRLTSGKISTTTAGITAAITSGKTGMPNRFSPAKACGSSLSRESMNWIETRSASAVLTAESKSRREDHRAERREDRADVVRGDHLEHVVGVRRACPSAASAQSGSSRAARSSPPPGQVQDHDLDQDRQDRLPRRLLDRLDHDPVMLAIASTPESASTISVKPTHESQSPPDGASRSSAPTPAIGVSPVRCSAARRR